MATTKKPRPRSDATKIRAQMRKLAPLGLSRNEMARRIGCAPSTISKYAKDLGLSFDRTRTAEATAAKTMDLAARRTALVEKMMIVAEQGIDAVQSGKIELVQITQAGKVVRVDRDVDQVDRRNALTSAGIAVDKATKLLDRDHGTEQAGSTLDLIEKGILAAARAIGDGEQTE